MTPTPKCLSFGSGSPTFAMSLALSAPAAGQLTVTIAVETPLALPASAMSKPVTFAFGRVPVPRYFTNEALTTVPVLPLLLSISSAVTSRGGLAPCVSVAKEVFGYMPAVEFIAGHDRASTWPQLMSVDLQLLQPAAVRFG